MKLPITVSFAFVFGSAALLMGCGDLSNETKIEIQMYGVAKAAATATGDHDPQFQTYKVESIVLNGASGDTVLLDAETSFKIVDRPQILLSKDAKKFKNTTFTGLTITFDPTVEGGDKDQSDLSFTLSAPSVQFAQPVTVTENKTTTYVVKAFWSNTLAKGAMTEPTLEISKQ